VKQCAALFVRKNSGYKGLAAECFDMERDARSYAGQLPVVAHPPCRAWGRLRHMAKPRHDERALALHAVGVVRKLGGVLEHPAASTLWPVAGLPEPGERDKWGGWTMVANQSAWGHRAPKPTRFYIVGCEPRDLPEVPFRLGEPAGRIEKMCAAERERTPIELARWLCDLAEICGRKRAQAGRV